MKFSEIELKRLMKKYQDTQQKVSLEEEIQLNILNFINTIHKNHQDFYASQYDSHMYGDVELWFSKEPNCLFGYCEAILKKDDVIIDYIFSGQGFERVDDVLLKDD